MQRDFDLDEMNPADGGCPMHGDDAMVVCPNCGVEFCQRCNPNSQVCPDCEKGDVEEGDGEERDEEFEAGGKGKGEEEEDAEFLPEDVKEDLESEGELGEQAFEARLHAQMKATSPRVPKAALPSKPAKPAPRPIKKVVIKPASPKPAKPKRVAPRLAKKPAPKPAPKKPVRKSRR